MEMNGLTIQQFLLMHEALSAHMTTVANDSFRGAVIRAHTVLDIASTRNSLKKMIDAYYQAHPEEYED
jgi:hypothetical protein